MNPWLNYLLRGLVVMITLFVLRWSCGPIAKRFLERSALETLGYELSIDRAYVSPIATEMELETVHVPHPNLPLEKWLECQHIWMDVEGSPLLRKKLVIRNARAIGVRLHDPTENMHFDANAFKRPAGWNLKGPARHALSNAFSEADTALQPAGSAELKSDLLLKQIANSWPTGMFELDNEFTVYELQYERLAEIAESLSKEKSSPEEDVAQTYQELQTLEQRILAFRKRVATLQTQCEVDQTRFQAAQTDDLVLLQTKPQVQLPGNASLSHYFLGSVSTEHAWEVLRLLHAAKAFFEHGIREPVPAKSVGLTLDYPRENSIPTFLLKALHFEGAGEFAGKPVRFAGSLQNLTNNPRMYHQPTRLVIDAHVPHRVVIEAVLDQTQNPPQQHIVIRCPNWPQPERALGETEQVAISASSCVLSLRAELHLSADELTGSVQTRHQKVGLKPRISDDWGGERVAHSLVDLLGSIQTVDSLITLEGKLSKPTIELRSPLGEQLAGGLQHGFEQELTYRLEQHLARWQHDQQVAFEELQIRLVKDSKRLLTRMSETGGQVTTLTLNFREQYPQLSEAYPQVATQGEAGVKSSVDRK